MVWISSYPLNDDSLCQLFGGLRILFFASFLIIFIWIHIDRLMTCLQNFGGSKSLSPAVRPLQYPSQHTSQVYFGRNFSGFDRTSYSSNFYGKETDVVRSYTYTTGIYPMLSHTNTTPKFRIYMEIVI